MIPTPGSQPSPSLTPARALHASVSTDLSFSNFLQLQGPDQVLTSEALIPTYQLRSDSSRPPHARSWSPQTPHSSSTAPLRPYHPHHHSASPSHMIPISSPPHDWVLMPLDPPLPTSR